MTDVWPEAQVQAAAAIIRAVYQNPGVGTPDPKEIYKHLETALDSSRTDWPMGLCRRMWEFVEDVAPDRARTAQHLHRWYHLAGYCLRPGFGDSLDRYRIEQLWKLIAAPFKTGSTAPTQQSEGGADYWIMYASTRGRFEPIVPTNIVQSLASDPASRQRKTGRQAGRQ